MELEDLMDSLRAIAAISNKSVELDANDPLQPIYRALQSLVVNFPQGLTHWRGSVDILRPIVDIFGSQRQTLEQRIEEMFDAAIAAAKQNTQQEWNNILKENAPMYARLGFQTSEATGYRSARCTRVANFAGLLVDAAELHRRPKGNQPSLVVDEPNPSASARKVTRRILIGAASVVVIGALLVGISSVVQGQFAIFGYEPLQHSSIVSPYCPPQSGATPNDEGTYVSFQQELVSSTNCWTPVLAPVRPGATIKYVMKYVNESDSVQKQVLTRVNLPPLVLYVPGTTYLYNQAHPRGFLLATNELISNGEDIGDYGVGANAFLVLKVVIPSGTSLGCGLNTFQAVGGAKPQGLQWQHKAATVAVYRNC